MAGQLTEAEIKNKVFFEVSEKYSNNFIAYLRNRENHRHCRSEKCQEKKSL